MPAKSKQQQKFMGIVRSIQKGDAPASKFSKAAQKVAKSMKKSDVKKYAKTKHDDLPKKVRENEQKLREYIRKEIIKIKESINEMKVYSKADGIKKLRSLQNTKAAKIHKIEKIKTKIDGKKVTMYNLHTKNKFHRTGSNPYGLDMAKNVYLIPIEESQLKERAWTPDQTKAVDKVDNEFNKLMAKKGIEPYSVEAARLWKSAGFDKKMGKIFGKKEGVNEAPQKYRVYVKQKAHVGGSASKKFSVEKFQTGGMYFDYKKGMDIIKKLRKMNSTADYKLVKEGVNEAKYTHEYPSITAMAKDYKRIFPTTGSARVKIISGSKREATGKRSQPAFITIDGDKKLIDAYKKIAFNGRGNYTDVIKSLDEGVNEAVNTQQANILMKQLGGRRFEMMMGVKSKAIGKDGLILHIGKNPKGVSHIIIDYDRGSDLYNIRFGKIRMNRYNDIKKLKGIAVDQLDNAIEKNTGLYTRF